MSIDRMTDLALEARKSPLQEVTTEMLAAQDQFEVERPDLDLMGLDLEVIRNWVQLQKILFGSRVDNKTRAIVKLLALVDAAQAETKLWKTHALQMGYRPGG